MHMNNTRWLTLGLLAPMLLASGCSTTLPSSPLPSFAPARIPAPSPEARQPPAPPWCSSTCSADARAGGLARAYDRARIAGLACEASYAALTNRKEPPP